VAIGPRRRLSIAVGAGAVLALAAAALIFASARPETGASATTVAGYAPRAARELHPAPVTPADAAVVSPTAAGGGEPVAPSANPAVPSVVLSSPAVAGINAASAPASPISPVADAAPSPPATAKVTLVGLPPGARASVDGAPVGAEFEMEVNDAPHVLKVAVPGRRPFVREFRVQGDTTIEVRMAAAGAGPSSRRDGGGRVPDAAPGNGPGFIANPFPQ
jgi:hypothetical protein